VHTTREREREEEKQHNTTTQKGTKRERKREEGKEKIMKIEKKDPVAIQTHNARAIANKRSIAITTAIRYSRIFIIGWKSSHVTSWPSGLKTHQSGT
jgi:hypothetical protein